jgi:hypothetical protein
LQFGASNTIINTKDFSGIVTKSLKYNLPFKGGFMKRPVSLLLLAMVALYYPSFSQDAQAPASAPSAEPSAAADVAAPAAASPIFSVDSMVFARGVEAREPMGVGSEFPSDVGKVACWARVSSSQSPVAVKFVWYKDGQVVFEWPYSLLSESGRLWATKTVSTGKWKVEIVDGAKNIVKTASFEVK